jgi:hypothetical protein
MYSDALSDTAVNDAGGNKIVYGLIDTDLPAPYTVQSMVSVQQSLGPTWMGEVSYVHTTGEDFPLSRSLSWAFDRMTGVRPNPALGNAAGYYITAEQTMNYNALQVSVRKRSASSLGFDVHYTLAEGWAHQGGNLTSNFVNFETFTVQDFWNPDIDRSPISDDTRHRLNANVVYEVPWFGNTNSAWRHALDGWQVAGIVRVRSGVPLRITQPSGIANSRPDFIGGDPVFDNWDDTLMYLNPASFALVPTSPITQATVRPGTLNSSDVYGPAFWTLDLSLAKSFRLQQSARLEIRFDAFNALNHVNYNNPTLSIVSPVFGQITSAAPARTGQIAAKLTF